jgi:hypothetical protein
VARTNKQLVAAVLGRNYDGTSDLSPWINTASSIVDEAVAVANSRNIPLSSVQQELMERWMAAHYYTQMDPLYKSKSELSASGTFIEQDFSKVAINMDPSKALGWILAGRPRGKVIWAGKTRSNALTYTDRDAPAKSS